MQSTLIIHNPVAGAGLAARRWKKFQVVLQQAGYDYEDQITEHPGHAIQIASEALASGYRRLAVFGGDGTLNETLQGIMAHQSFIDEVLLTFLPAGSSCDFARLYPKGKSLLQRLTSGDEFIVDVCFVEGRDEDGGPTRRYFLNNSSIGIISLAGVKFAQPGPFINWLKKISVDAAAVSAGLSAISTFTPIDGSLAVDGSHQTSTSMTNITVFKTPFFGGGMHYGTETRLDDGTLYVATIAATSRGRLVRLMPTLYSGTTFEKPEADLIKCSSLRFETDEPGYIETDGEMAGLTPAKYGILPRTLKVIM
ncbi:MAG: diacylglycerol kinase family lipid kinase [Candidatus Marinimicrobia bacterium]|nr:diacylglycerol kinase family lipid kinase [Candidatus Neomarinimicrobiota bacterium]